MMNHSAVRLFLVLAVSAFLSSAALAGVVGSGTPSSCTGAALQAQIAAGGTITFNCGAGPQTITLTNTVGVSSTNPKVTIDGGDTITLDGTGMTSEIVAIFGTTTSLPDATFKHITFANGNITTGLGAGGAIQNFGHLTLDTVTFTKNQSAGGGAIFQEPCTGCPNPSLTVSHCLFQNNTTTSGTGAAISMEGGIASIADSTFSGNTAAGSGAIDIFSNNVFKVVMSIDRCTFNGNAATSFGGGAINVESLNTGSSVTITDSTFTGNTAMGSNGQGSAIYIGAAPVTITNCTIAGNSAATAGGAVSFGNRTPVTEVVNTIIASNSGGNCSNASAGTFTGSHNLQFGDSTCTGMTVANPLLGPLTDNGGLTPTMALGAGSPAIDAGDTGAAPPTDQRGLLRNDGNGDGIVAADIGAFEAPKATGGDTTASRRRHAVKP
jgi:hypothetical protein